LSEQCEILLARCPTSAVGVAMRTVVWHQERLHSMTAHGSIKPLSVCKASRSLEGHRAATTKVYALLTITINIADDDVERVLDHLAREAPTQWSSDRIRSEAPPASRTAGIPSRLAGSGDRLTPPRGIELVVARTTARGQNV